MDARILRSGTTQARPRLQQVHDHQSDGAQPRWGQKHPRRGLPAITGAGLLELLELLGAGPGAGQLWNLALGIGAAAVSGYAAIGLLLRLLERFGTPPFAAYRVGLGAFIRMTLRA